MKRNTFFMAFICIMALLFVTVLGSCQTVQEQSKKTNPTVGVWRIVYPPIDTTNYAKVKIITEGHFIWTHTYKNAIVNSLGGTCTFDGKTYTEEVQYRSPNMWNSIGEKAVYDVKFEDGKMHCTGTFGREGVINEIWERVE